MFNSLILRVNVLTPPDLIKRRNLGGVPTRVPASAVFNQMDTFKFWNSLIRECLFCPVQRAIETPAIFKGLPPMNAKAAHEARPRVARCKSSNQYSRP